jgi:hypothetical protein
MARQADTQALAAELAKVKSAHVETLQALENEKSRARAGALEVAVLQKTVKRLEEEVAEAAAAQRAASELVDRKMEDARQKAAADAEAKGATELERLTASLQVCVCAFVRECVNTCVRV